MRFPGVWTSSRPAGGRGAYLIYYAIELGREQTSVINDTLKRFGADFMTQFFKITQKSECFGRLISSCILMPGIIVTLFYCHKVPSRSLSADREIHLCIMWNIWSPFPQICDIKQELEATTSFFQRSSLQPFINTHLLEPIGRVNFWSSYLGIRAEVRTVRHLPRHPKSCDHMGGETSRQFAAVESEHHLMTKTTNRETARKVSQIKARFRQC